jgi:catechol 2,3-dioxygenase-like lactoylglutathione lyase family enzyme
MIDNKPNMPQLEFTHCAIFVHDMARMEDFYAGVLNYPVTDRGELNYPPEDNLPTAHLVFLSQDADEHHQVILVDGRPEHLPFNPINHLASRVRNLAELRMAWERIQGEDCSEIRPVTHGNAWSVYFRDPEGNRLEIYTPTPWHISQPFRIPIDLTKSDEEITEWTLKLIEESPGFTTRENRKADMQALIDNNK